MLYLFIIIAIIALDQWSKHWAYNTLRLQELQTIPLIKDVFHLTYVENRGAAFSIFDGQRSFLLIITGITLLFVSYQLYKLINSSNDIILKLSLAMILAGGIGNMIDRVKNHFVVDFFDFRLINFAVFNIADCFVVIGAALMCLDLLLKKDV